jgi:predicted double-glycine peptidase
MRPHGAHFLLLFPNTVLAEVEAVVQRSRRVIQGDHRALARASRSAGTDLRRLIVATSLIALMSFGPTLAAERGPVKSLLEMRRERVVVQQWDLSCGAAALATILNYQHDDPVSEREIAKGLIHREEYVANPTLVRVRQGFSLLDLKRYVDRRGYEGIGYGQLTLDDLIERAPIMVPVRFNGYNHFVVFRGMRGNRVLLADPAFGNRTMLADKFVAGWLEHADLGKVGFVVARANRKTPPNKLAPRALDFVSLK